MFQRLLRALRRFFFKPAAPTAEPDCRVDLDAMAADLELTDALETITGQEPNTAVAYLRQTLPLRDTPTVQVWPLWVKRMPYLARRIKPDVQTHE